LHDSHPQYAAWLEGALVGCFVGWGLVGKEVGIFEGSVEGSLVGLLEGEVLGRAVGLFDGGTVGGGVGTGVPTHDVGSQRQRPGNSDATCLHASLSL